jgi:DNA-directed RNA polymerase sigma subunit (sigma70/sigma32)
MTTVAPTEEIRSHAMKKSRHSRETLREEVRATLSKLTPRERAALLARFGLDLVAGGPLTSGTPGDALDDDNDREEEIQSLVMKLVAAKAKKKLQ